MKRRPHIPLKVRLQVAYRQIGNDPAEARELAAAAVEQRRGATVLKALLDIVRKRLGEEVLRLDHTWALGLREYSPKTGRWTPDANDPDYLRYRGYHGHDVKTYVRGDRGQFSDTTLMVRERRRKRKSKKLRHKWPTGRKLQGRGFVKRSRP